MPTFRQPRAPPVGRTRSARRAAPCASSTSCAAAPPRGRRPATASCCGSLTVEPPAPWRDLDLARSARPSSSRDRASPSRARTDRERPDGRPRARPPRPTSRAVLARRPPRRAHHLRRLQEAHVDLVRVRLAQHLRAHRRRSSGCARCARAGTRRRTSSGAGSSAPSAGTATARSPRRARRRRSLAPGPSRQPPSASSASSQVASALRDL